MIISLGMGIRPGKRSLTPDRPVLALGHVSMGCDRQPGSIVCLRQTGPDKYLDGQRGLRCTSFVAILRQHNCQPAQHHGQVLPRRRQPDPERLLRPPRQTVE